MTFLCYLQNAVVIYVFSQVTRDERLVNNRIPKTFVLFFADTEDLKVVVMVGGNFFCFVAEQYVFYIVVSKVFFGCDDDFQ